MSAPDVTLIMPAWNTRAEHLAAAVESALGQEGVELELLLVDDGSEPPLAAPEDSRLRLLRIEHGGPYGARNAALEVARGAFVRYADADDVVEPDSTARLLALADGGRRIAYGTTLVCDADLNPVRTMASSARWIRRRVRKSGQCSRRNIWQKSNGCTTTRPG